MFTFNKSLSSTREPKSYQSINVVLILLLMKILIMKILIMTKICHRESNDSLLSLSYYCQFKLLSKLYTYTMRYNNKNNHNCNNRKTA